jgi:hypothetical protein
MKEMIGFGSPEPKRRQRPPVVAMERAMSMIRIKLANRMIQ